MEKQMNIGSAHVSAAIPQVRGERADSGHPRSGWSREELRVEIKRVRQQRRTLAISTVILLLACSGLALWELGQQSTRHVAMTRQLDQIDSLSDQLAAATTELEASRRAVDDLVADRIPGLLPFQVGEPLSVDIPFVREFSFKPAAPPISGHECKLVIENQSNAVIRPTLSVVLFDGVGVQLARAQLVDGAHDEMRADEIRSFFANLEIADGEIPRYFRLTSD